MTIADAAQRLKTPSALGDERLRCSEDRALEERDPLQRIGSGGAVHALQPDLEVGSRRHAARQLLASLVEVPRGIKGVAVRWPEEFFGCRPFEVIPHPGGEHHELDQPHQGIGLEGELLRRRNRVVAPGEGVDAVPRIGLLVVHQAGGRRDARAEIVVVVEDEDAHLVDRQLEPRDRLHVGGLTRRGRAARAAGRRDGEYEKEVSGQPAGSSHEFLRFRARALAHGQSVVAAATSRCRRQTPSFPFSRMAR